VASLSENEPGRAVRIACAWLIGVLLVATAAHVLLLPPKPAAEPAEEAGEPPAALAEGVPLTRTAAGSSENPLDAGRAMGYLRAICELGPRISGSEAMKRQQEIVVEHFEKLGAEVELQRFAARHPQRRSERVPMANLIARWRPEAPRRVLLCAHYDTRPLPDQDPDPRARKTGVCLGANDGASGVAVLMELGHVMAERFADEAADPDFGIDFVLFDGEELVYTERDPYFLGSQWFATQYAKRTPRPGPDGGEPVAWSYGAAVLLDMVGDADLELYFEGYSFSSRQSRPICREVWDVADRLGVDEFVPRPKYSVKDDHLALRKYGGIRAIDVIDFDYPYWHTTEDTPDKCSGRSLAKVGWVMWEWLLERGAD